MSLGPDRRAHVIDDGIRLANGLGFSPDGHTLYFADSAARVIFGYDYNSLEGTVHNRRTFVRVSAHEGVPDGLTVDTAGLFGAHTGSADVSFATTRTAEWSAAFVSRQNKAPL
jgi:sugar lactone lactonase YvrE